MDDVSNQYALEFAQMPNHLQVTVRADVWTPAMAERYNRELAGRVKDLEAERVLIIRDIPVTLRLVAVFPLMSDFVEGLGGRKVAVVNPFPDLTDDLNFAIQIAANRGADYRLFSELGEAEKWLLGHLRSP